MSSEFRFENRASLLRAALVEGVYIMATIQKSCSYTRFEERSCIPPKVLCKIACGHTTVPTYHSAFAPTIPSPSRGYAV